MNKQTNEYYQTTEHIPFTEKLSVNARKKMYALFMNIMEPSKTSSILDVGVTCDKQHPASNMLEYCYPHKKQITCAGVENAYHLEKIYLGVKFHQFSPHKPLPFEDKQFDIAYSNAVLEHVGTRAQQTAFIHELCRVGKEIFITVPNRLFPVEHHTALPLVHYLPNSCFRVIAKLLGITHWSKKENLNLFYPWKIGGFFPKEMKPSLAFTGVGIAVFKSNICVYSKGSRVK